MRARRRNAMPASVEHYRAVINQQETQLLPFLRTFEALQENLHLGKVKQHKQELYDTIGDLFPPLNAALDELSPPPDLQTFHQQWCEVLTQLEDAYTSFLTGSEFNFFVAYFQSRRAFSLGKYQLYSLRGQLPTLQQYWVLPEELPRITALETPVAGVTASTGVIHRPATKE